MSTGVHVAYTGLVEATRNYLAHERNFGTTVWPGDRPYPAIEIELVDVSGDAWGYPKSLQRRWERGEEFINIEHDVVGWPGAADDLLSCPRQWCFFGYLPRIDCVANGCAPFGMVKFSAQLIQALPAVWEEMAVHPDDGRPWASCDLHFYAYASARGFVAHQHWPSVLNANPKITFP